MADIRPSDWYPLVEDASDPVPGDWELVEEAAARYRRTAEAIETARTLLRDVTDSRDGWRSEAGDAFREKATELSDDVFQAYGRYDAVATALAEYWPELRDAQEESLDLWRSADAAQDEIDALTRQVTAAADEDSDTHEDLGRLEGDLGLARAELQRFRDRLEQVVEDKDNAAQRAADAIGEFIGSDGLKDGFFDSMFSAFQDAMAVLGEIAGQIAMYAGIASLALCWVPVLGQALAAVATIATVISLAGNLINGDWHGVLLDSIGLLTFGAGRLAGAAARTVRTRAARTIDEVSDSALSSIPRNLPVRERLAMYRAEAGGNPSTANAARRQLQESTDLVDSPMASLRNTLPDLRSSLRDGFRPSQWQRADSWQEAMGLTDSSLARTDMAGMGSAASWAGAGEVASWGAGTATTLWTHDADSGIQMNTPVQLHPSDGWSANWNLPFSDTPGMSLTDEPLEVGDFPHGESGARVR
ncbi:putative T7SS-secreted protein [Streptomyces sp. 4N509B]|uniref:putative T7SS-secreted protein n=1 Tax=Streptomyces sp. 4N509B TaxID=3457413 RepID=UPI003FD363B6